MYQPQTYTAALSLMIAAMLCWGSWANTQKLVGAWPFQLFYWDYVIGVVLASIVLGLTAGSIVPGPSDFVSQLGHAGSTEILYALAGGIVFNAANLLLVAAISIAGLAVAFPVGIGLALIVGVILNYLLAPAGSPLLLFGGVALVAAAIVVDAVASGRRGTEAGAPPRRGVVIALICGVMMGCFFPLVTRASTGPAGLGPYAVSFVFSIGIVICAIPFNLYLMKRPITADAPTSMAQYGRGSLREHAAGVAGGAIWGGGTICSFVAAHTTIVGPAVSYAIGQGATMISAAWGVFVWREFAGAPRGARVLLLPMFVLFILGLTAVALAPLYGSAS